MATKKLAKKAKPKKTAKPKKQAPPKKAPAPKLPWRPTKYSEPLAARICGLIAEGKSLVSICSMASMPSLTTTYVWLQKYETFRETYTRAREDQADTLADEMLGIADDSRNDYVTVDGVPMVDNEHIQRSRLRIETRKWLASKLKAKKYGDKVQAEVTGADGKEIAMVVRTELLMNYVRGPRPAAIDQKPVLGAPTA